MRRTVQQFLDDKELESVNVGADMRKINYCFKYIKELYLLSKVTPVLSSNNNNNNNTKTLQPINSVTIVDSSHYDSKEMKDLKETLRQRDNEISILVNMLKKEKKKNADFSSGYYNRLAFQ